ncbi:plasmid partitioning protein RepB [Sulfitobacter sp. JB4-11]|uniref:plasmid partitioning protein RepB n=1 Tax=Sulfitobacter rhodophyticola TaxID=3238304 RepID=UPI0035173393
MSDGKKKRMAMLDNLAAASTPPPSMMTNNRALRSARDAVDSHRVWDLDPWAIEDTRIADRLDPNDVYDLRDAIEANGQTVPILVRRHPTQADRYLLVYGRRRLEAIRQSQSVDKIRALVASMEDHDAVRAQISENMARRDLTFIEKALFAKELIENDFGTQTQVAEVLTVTKSAISMALAVVDAVGTDLVRIVGPAQGIGRPRWEALARDIAASGIAPDRLCTIAEEAYSAAEKALVVEGADGVMPNPSVAAFQALERAVNRPAPRVKPPSTDHVRSLKLDGRKTGTIRRSDKGLRIDIQDEAFAGWLDDQLEDVLHQLHSRWSTGKEENQEQN